MEEPKNSNKRKILIKIFMIVLVVTIGTHEFLYAIKNNVLGSN